MTGKRERESRRLNMQLITQFLNFIDMCGLVIIDEVADLSVQVQSESLLAAFE